MREHVLLANWEKDATGKLTCCYRLVDATEAAPCFRSYLETKRGFSDRLTSSTF